MEEVGGHLKLVYDSIAKEEIYDAYSLKFEMHEMCLSMFASKMKECWAS